MLSRRVALDRTPNALARALAAHRDAGRPVIDLTSGNPTAVGLPEVPLAASLGATGAASSRYEPHPLGLPSARRAVAAELGRLEGREVDPDRVVLTASTSEAYAALFKVLADPGDVVLVPRPSYPLFDHLARFEGLEIAPFDLDDDGGGRWRVDPESFARAAASPRARAVLAGCPNNPTGSYLHPEDLARLAEPGLPILVDEVFRHHPLASERPPVPSAVELPVGVPVCVLGGLSKHVGLPQAKLAWTVLAGPAADRESLRAHLELVLDASLALGTPIQVALPAILDAGAAVRAAIRERTSSNLVAARERVRGTALTIPPAEGGWYGTIRLPRTLDDDGWARVLLEEADVWTQPGWLYDFDSRQARIVVSLLTECKPFSVAIARIVARVSSLS